MPSSVFEATAGGNLRWPGGTARCVLGRSGVIDALAKSEGDGATPLGFWPMRRVYFRANRISAPHSRLLVQPLTSQMGWCDDPASPDYNHLVALPFTASHEKLWREDRLYDLIVELGYNDAPVVPGLGSAIFLHVAAPEFSPTEGCVATDIVSLLALVAKAAPGDSLAIVR
ncbi:MAG: L,D-transpeptidase family protein [Alphaproteobacteria bacterium]